MNQENVIAVSNELVQAWEKLVSDSNWAKGEIASRWKSACVDSVGYLPSQADELFAQTVQGITTPHVGRLRHVYERFNAIRDRWPTLRWTHFCRAENWDDAEAWLSRAAEHNWSSTEMYMKRFAGIESE